MYMYIKYFSRKTFILYAITIVLVFASLKIASIALSDPSFIPQTFQHFDRLVLSWKGWNYMTREESHAVWENALKLPVDHGKSMGRRDIYSLFSPTFECDRNLVTRIGAGGDGGKWTCGEFFKKKDDCVVMSIGSNGDFSFEQAVLEHPNGRDCVIHTFDCTGSWAVPDKRINFHPWCLSKEDGVVEGKTFKSWDSILKEQQIKSIDLLKMDIEGYEWNTLPYMLQHPEQSKLPKQVFLEMHFFPPGHAKEIFQGGFQPAGTPAELLAEDGLDYLHPAVRLFQLFDSRGYQIAATEYNHLSIAECCQEFTFVNTEMTE